MSKGAEDPYAPPAAELERAPPKVEGPRVARALLLGHEARAKAVGALFLALSLWLLMISGGVGSGTWFLYGLVIGFLFLGSGLVGLRAWARRVAGAFLILFLILFPIGTLIGGYGLWVLYSSDGRDLFTAEHQQICQETPEMKASVAPTLVMVLVVAALATASLLI
ncbi:MAG: hypothetical protein JKY65_03760 [Planctomycetes bacterium]|nr:hypothetical protein [Planctomycetota bacterium]